MMPEKDLVGFFWSLEGVLAPLMTCVGLQEQNSSC